MIVLRKKKVVRKVLISQGGGEIKTDRIPLPDAALCITGVKAIGRHLDINDPEISKLDYLYGTSKSLQLGADELSALTVGTYQNLHPEFQVNAPSDSGLYIYFAHPTSLTDPYFTYQGFTGGFLNQGTIALQGGRNGVQQFRVWRSTNANLGENVTVTANHQ